MAAEIDISRPNIRIQIPNLSSTKEGDEAMEVDQQVKENEEGEISDDNMEEDADLGPDNKMLDLRATFTTGINVFDKKEQEKLQERAKRFALKPDEINSFTDENLEELHDSLGINPANQSEVKFETIHLLGLGKMNPEDIVDYFSNYAPEGIEYLDHDSCNVVWLDNLSAARSLHYKSRVVRGMPAREPKDMFPKEFLDDEPTLEDGQSILIKNKNREIELQNDIGEIIQPKKKTFPKNSVDISEINIPIPPGYWRLGLDHPKTKCLLLRFGNITDKIPYKSEKCSKYFKKVSSKTGISESKKQELRGIFERNKELDKKNPWGSLARNWEKDAKFREREPIMYNENSEDEVEIVSVKNPKLQARLGKKKVRTPRQEITVEEEPEEDIRNVRLQMERPNLPEKKKTKVPRMKMYADEEEENQKRRKILMKIKKQTEEIEKKNSRIDLRNMLGPSNRLLLKKDEPVPAIDLTRQADLGAKLRNRSLRMIFAVEREHEESNHYDIRNSRDVRREILIRPDRTRHVINRDRSRSPILHRSVLLRQREELEGNGHKEERERERRQGHRERNRRSIESTLHSDRIHSSRSSHLRRRSHSTETKPRSKVAVVVPRKPAVASTIWSKVKQSESSESDSSESESEQSESESESSSSSSSSASESESESGSSRSSEKRITARNPDRPGFDKSRLSAKVDHKSPLKITTKNEHFKQKSSRRA